MHWDNPEGWDREESGRGVWNGAPVFIAALFTLARTWKQPRCPPTDEWTKKLWYIYTMEYYSSVKRNIFESVLMRWTNLEPIVQSACVLKKAFCLSNK